MKKEYDLTQLKKRPGKVPVDPNAANIQINLPLHGIIFAQLKTVADGLGASIQVLMCSILHQYARGKLISKKTVDMLKN